MAKSKTALTTILGQLPTARAVAKREKDEGRRAIGAHYDRRTQRILVELTSGFLFGFPAASIPELAHAPIEQRARVTVSSGGGGLHWPGLDVDLSVPGLLLASVGRKERLHELARFLFRYYCPLNLQFAPKLQHPTLAQQPLVSTLS